MRAVITGATKGIGRACANIFAKNGFDLAICARTEADVQSFSEALKKTFPKIDVIAAVVDVSKKKEVKNFVQTIKQRWESLDVLINNAGVFIPSTLSELENEESFEYMMSTNLYSAYYITNGLLPLMLKQKCSSMFNLCSVASFEPYGAYAVSKHALLGFSRVLREELKDQGVRVTAVMPGATLTASWANASHIPEKRFMKAEDIAKSIWDTYQLSPQTVVEEIILRPQKGDISS